jgi:two-component system phosphate regulon sensor histidine kinase PhoR
MAGVRIGTSTTIAVIAAVSASLFAERLLVGATGPWTSRALSVLAGLVVGGAVAAPFYLQMRARIAQLARATRALAQGDFEVALPHAADDELGDLQRAWKRMRLVLEERVLDLDAEVGRQRLILDGMAEGVALLGNGEIQAANPAFARLIGASGDVIGKTPLELARLPELTEAIDDSIQSHAEVVRELHVETRILRVAVRPFGHDHPRQMVVVLLDMTEARRLERLRRDFVANASHELRTPVAAILGAVETLAAGAAEDVEARASFLQILERHAQRLTRLTADLLDLARLEAGYRPRAEIVPLRVALDAVIPTLAPRAREKSIELTSRLLPPDGEFELLAERAAVEQVLTNLVDNAVKYTPVGGSITVVGELKGDHVEISVADTGPGISAEHLPRLFERFYRVDDARSRALGGTGLGLSIVKHLVAANGGEIEVASAVGRGTRFTVRFAVPQNRSPEVTGKSHPA